jgi:hypothetical protein
MGDLAMKMKMRLLRNVTSDDICHSTLTCDFVLSQTPLPSLELTQSPIQWVPGPSPGLKRPWRDVHHSPTSSAEFKNEWSYASTPPLRFHGVYRNNYLRLRG